MLMRYTYGYVLYEFIQNSPLLGGIINEAHKYIFGPFSPVALEAK